MCGIVGVFTRAPIDLETVPEQLAAMIAHRGPDDMGTYTTRSGDRTLVLVHSRLAILDLSAKGHQPMVDPQTGNRIILNGEIYNFRELRRELEDGEEWHSQSDTEVILRAYRRWGKECLPQFRGMFAFALWDQMRRELVLARDRFGIKPLYYFESSDTVAFSSELRPLLQTFSRRQTSVPRIALFLRHQTVPTPATLVDDIRMLEPGTVLSIPVDGAARCDRYASLNGAASPDISFEEASERTRQMLLDSVREHLVSDVPVACFLSGGMDSTGVLALSAAAGSTPRTFTVSFDQGNGEDAKDEGEVARRTASRYGATHTELRLDPADILDQIPSALGSLDHPTGDAINTYVISRAVRACGYKVALSGIGADELFGGYPSFGVLRRYATVHPLLSSLPTSIRQGAASWIDRIPTARPVRRKKLAWAVRTAASPVDVYLEFRAVFDAERLAKLGLQQAALDPFHARLSQLPDGGITTRTSVSELTTYMQDVLLRDSDQMSMSQALELRVPFLDYRLVDFVLSLPESAKWKGSRQKPLLAHALRDLLPAEVVRRPKSGFALPMSRWMHGPLRSLCGDRLGNGVLRRTGVISGEEVDRLWSDFEKGTVGWAAPWLLVVLEDWMQRNRVSVSA
jgi:asparagine synthase (glutamine-hydrolysing)